MDNIRSFSVWPLTNEIAIHFSAYEPFHLSSVGDCPSSVVIRAVLQTVQNLVDVSCANDDEHFCGHPARREKVDIKFADFLAAWNCYQAGHEHWLLETDLRLYLSQCCIYCKSDPHLCELSDGELIQHVCSLIKDNCDIAVEQINLWMNIQHSQSTLHYDANHNLLVLLEGSKTVTLLSPSCTKHLSPAGAADEHPNHSSLAPEAVDSLVADMRRAATEGANTYAGCICHVVAMRAGEVLFIPEGWWHQVVSDKCSMALNYWFPSPLQAWVRSDNREAVPSEHCTPHISMNEYILRAVVHQLVQGEPNQPVDLHVSQAAVGLYVDLTYVAFESYILQDLLPSVDTTMAAGDALSGRKRTADEAESTSAEKALERFVRCDFADMQRLWVPFAAQHGQEWVKLLLSLPPSAAHHLLSCWDSLETAAGTAIPAATNVQTADDSDKETKVQVMAGGESVDANADVLGEFFRDIFAPCGDSIPQVRGYLIAQKDKHREKCAKRVLSKVLGLSL